MIRQNTLETEKKMVPDAAIAMKALRYDGVVY
jgi:hypothetical protein